jgi:hypothetical protein
MIPSTLPFISLPQLTSSLTSSTSPSPTPLFSTNFSNNILPPIKDASTIQDPKIKTTLPPINDLIFSIALNNRQAAATCLATADQLLSPPSSSTQQRQTTRPSLKRRQESYYPTFTEINRDPSFKEISTRINHKLKNLFFFKHSISSACKTTTAIRRNKTNPEHLKELETFLKLAAYDSQIVQQSLQNDKNNKK